jgi:hypothetical protein
MPLRTAVVHSEQLGRSAQLKNTTKAMELIMCIIRYQSMIEEWAIYGEHMIVHAGQGSSNPELRFS